MAIERMLTEAEPVGELIGRVLQYFWPPIAESHQSSMPRAVKRHWDGILQWFDSKIANGLIVGINSLVQAAKAKARVPSLNPQPQGHHPPGGRQARPTTARKDDSTHPKQRGTHKNTPSK